MYSIYADGVCIYNDVFSLDNMKVVNPKLTLEDSAAGSLEMTLPPTNAAYDTIVRMVTDISVKKNGEEIDLVSIPKVSSQTIQHRFIRVQNSKISLGKHYIALFHRVSLPVSWIKSVFSIP